MTARQTGKQISAMYGNRKSGRGSPKPGTGGRQSPGIAYRRLVQLLICGTLFVTLVAAKLLLPSKMERFGSSVSVLLEQNMDVSQAFSAIGRALSGAEDAGGAAKDIYQAVFHPEQETAVPVSAAIEPQFGEKNPLAPMQTYAKNGDSGGWLLNNTDSEASDTAKTDHAQQSSDDADRTAVSSEDTKEPEGQTLQISSVLYSGENIPANVTLEQAVLGFDYCTPVCGTLSSNFGYREHPLDGEEKFHYGVDLAADTGTEIDCFADGTVTAVGESSSYGKYLTVSHSNGYSTLYAHCSSIAVSSGAVVREGEKIAEVGETGLATGPHLHFELHQGSQYMDPIYYVSLQ